MVAIGTERGHEQYVPVADLLQNHWMLDEVTANEVAQSSTAEGTQVLHDLVEVVESNPEALQKRDENRDEIIKIFQGESEKKLIVIGPCSLDMEAKYTQLFDYIEELQVQHPSAVIAWRGNGAKPRSGIGPTGTFNSMTPGSRKRQLEIYKDAFERGIPILTEITDKDQFATLAPYLSGAWLGARDMGATELRKLFSATRLPVLVKNSTDGRIKSLWDAIKAIRSNTETNKGSGVSMGFLSTEALHEDGGPAMFTVGEGNPNVAIIARGYDLDEEQFDGETLELVSTLSEAEREQKAIEHLSKMCMLAAKVDCVAILDGSHQVPRMFSEEDDKKEGGRFLNTIKKFRQAARERRIKNVERLVGYLGEVSTSVGFTDVNLVLTDEVKREISAEVHEFKNLNSPPPALPSTL